MGKECNDEGYLIFNKNIETENYLKDQKMKKLFKLIRLYLLN